VELRLYVDADFAGSREDTKSTSGGFLVLTGENTFFPLSWLSRKQTSTSKSTAEAELVSLSLGLFDEGIPMQNFWQMISGYKVPLVIKEDNEAAIKVVRKGFSPKLRSLSRTHRVNIGAIHEIITHDDVRLEHETTKKQAADIFTKGLEPQQWGPALELIGMKQLPLKGEKT
jgi:hypothetical protein